MTLTGTLLDHGVDVEPTLTISIDHHYNGPVGMAHGGTAAGRLAELLDAEAASVRLHAPVPLATPLQCRTNDDRAEVHDRDQQIASVRRLDAPLEVSRTRPTSSRPRRHGSVSDTVSTSRPPVSRVVMSGPTVG